MPSTTVPRLAKYIFEPRDLRIIRPGGRGPLADVQEKAPPGSSFAAGPMYDRTGTRSCGGGSHACTRQYDVTNEKRLVNEPGCFPRDGVTISVVDGTALVRKGAEIAGSLPGCSSPHAKVAIQLYPLLVWEGTPTTKTQSLSSVAGLGVRRDGKLVSLIGGRATLAALAQAFLAEDCYAAGYTDAGPSATLWLAGGTGYVGPKGKLPRLPAWLVFLDPLRDVGRVTGITLNPPPPPSRTG